ncbi:MAG: hypothetical protein HFG20_08645 [Anaerotruncus sp.]|nr:hypothetical protein [Anaerotruncus sp.]
MDAYPDLYNLIQQNAQAHQFFTALPDEVRRAVSYQARELHSMQELENYAGELLSDYD